MEDITVTEKYALCILNERDNLFDNGDLLAHLVVSMIFEMILEGSLVITEKNKVKCTNKEPKDTYCIQLYNFIKETKKTELSLKEIIPNICVNNTEKKSITDIVKNAMVEKKLISIENKKRILKNKEVIVLNKSELNNIREEIKNKILENDKFTDDMMLLAALLNATQFLQKTFEKFERKALNYKMKEIEKMDEKLRIVHSIIYEIENIDVIMWTNF